MTDGPADPGLRRYLRHMLQLYVCDFGLAEPSCPRKRAETENGKVANRSLPYVQQELDSWEYANLHKYVNDLIAA